MVIVNVLSEHSSTAWRGFLSREKMPSLRLIGAPWIGPPWISPPVRLDHV